MKRKYTPEEEKKLNEQSDAWDREEMEGKGNPGPVKFAPPELEAEIDDALGLQPITLRLQRDLVTKLKQIAKENGLGYQPFVRQVLTKFVADHKRQESSSMTVQSR